MKERPILFSAPMVNAILDGRKTQTRRIIKPQPDVIRDPFPTTDDVKGIFKIPEKGAAKGIYRCLGMQNFLQLSPYGQAGERLWVRETFGLSWDNETGLDIFVYRADDPEQHRYDNWKPSIHMPRRASRINLEITVIRVERLQDISEDDAIAEGITGPHDVGYQAYKVPDDSKPRYSNAISAYESLWESINGRESWEANPWVWVIEFKKLETK